MTAPTKSRTRRYLTAIVRCLAVTSSVFIATYVTGTYITGLLPKLYTATAQIQIRGDSPDNANVSPATLETILAPAVLMPVIKSLNLDAEWAKRTSQDTPLSALEAAGTLDKMVRLETPRGTNIVNISVTDDVAQESADIANAIADGYKALRDSEVQPQTTTTSPRATRFAANSQGAIFTIGAVPGSVPSAAPAVMTDSPSAPKPAVVHDSPVHIVSRAQVPKYPSSPNHHFCVAVTLASAVILSLMIASFVEVICLFLRAAEGAEGAEALAPLPTKNGS